MYLDTSKIFLELIPEVMVAILFGPDVHKSLGAYFQILARGKILLQITNLRFIRVATIFTHNGSV